MSPAGIEGLSRCTVIGAGTMGVGIVHTLARAGVMCSLVDDTLWRAERGREHAVELAQAFVSGGLWPDGAAETIDGRLDVGELENAVSEAELVIEAVSEDRAIKHQVLRRVEAAAPAGSLIATNTSAIPIASLSQVLETRERFLGWHWFNPAQWVPCVEVIPTADTSHEMVVRSLEILTALGKEPAVVGDAAGFVANRIQFAMFKEAAAVVADGVADADTVDRVVTASFGFRLPFYGPFQIADMAGLDVYAGAYVALQEALGPAFAAPPSLNALLERGRRGAKSGGGYLDWEPEDTRRLLASRDAAYAALAHLLAALGDGPS